MTVRLESGTILLEGDCASGEAEELLQLLLAEPAAEIDWRSCRSAHTAVVQLLLAACRDLLGPPQDEFLNSFIGPALNVGQS